MKLKLWEKQKNQSIHNWWVRAVKLVIHTIFRATHQNRNERLQRNWIDKTENKREKKRKYQAGDKLSNLSLLYNRQFELLLRECWPVRFAFLIFFFWKWASVFLLRGNKKKKKKKFCWHKKGTSHTYIHNP